VPCYRQVTEVGVASIDTVNSLKGQVCFFDGIVPANTFSSL